jgi:hypothetical protein
LVQPDPEFAEDLAIENFEAHDPLEQAEMLARDDDKRQQEFQRRKQEELQAADDERKQNLRVVEEANAKTDRRMAELATDARRVASTEPDRDGWWNSRSTGQKIAAYLSAMIGGWLSPLQGGRNSALEMIQSEMNADIDRQTAAIERQGQAIASEQGLVAREYARHGDMFRARETARIAGLQDLDERLAAEQVQLDPNGTRVRSILQARSETRAAMSKAAEDQRKQAFNDQLKIGEVERKEREFAERQRSARAGEGIARRGLAQREREYALDRADKIADRDAAERAAQAAPSPTGLRNPDGTPFTTGDTTGDREISNQVAGFAAMDQAASDLENHLRTHADAEGIISWGRLGTTEREQTRALMNNLHVAAIQAQKSGTISKRSLDGIEQVTGGDWTKQSRANPLATLRTQREAAHRRISAGLRAREYKGELPVPSLEIDRAQSAATPEAIDAVDEDRRRKRQEEIGLKWSGPPLPDHVLDELEQRSKLEQARQGRDAAPAPGFDPRSLPGVK